MHDNNLPEIQIDRTPDGYVARVPGKGQTGPLPSLPEAQQAGEELQQIGTKSNKGRAMTLILILSAASGAIGWAVFGTFGDAFIVAISAFLGMILAYFWSTL